MQTIRREEHFLNFVCALYLLIKLITLFHFRYIGDTYLRCTDLPDKSFLKKGATYRLLGGSTAPQLMKDNSGLSDDIVEDKADLNISRAISRFVLHNETSQLYQELYNGGQYKLTVVLTSDLACDNKECLVDTVRVVKVDSVYYEFVEQPCLQMSFYNGAKQIQARANMRPAQQCADPRLPVASEACCLQERYGETNATKVNLVTFFYDGEREKYDTAKSRCMDYGKDLCMFKRVYSTPVDRWFLEGQL